MDDVLFVRFKKKAFCGLIKITISFSVEKKKEKKITRNGINLNAFNMLVLRLIISFNVICVL